MRILRIILHSIFLIAGAMVLLNIVLPEQYINTIFLGTIGYAILILSYSVILELFLLSFPRFLGILLIMLFFSTSFFLNDFNIFSREILFNYLKIISIVIIAVFLLLDLINSFPRISYARIKTHSYKISLIINNTIFLTIIVLSFMLYVNTNKNKENLIYAIAFLMVLFPYFNKTFIQRLAHSLKPRIDDFKLDISFNQLVKMAKIKNFVFSKDKLIESNDYQLIDSDFRSTVRVITATQLSLQLANMWNRKYAKLFVNDEFENSPVKFDIVEQNDSGICVIDDKAGMYHFGTYAFVKDKIRPDNKSNLFLLKNDLTLAKYIVNEKISPEKTELINQLDYYGNTILFNPGIKEDLGRDYSIVFDKVYSGLNEEKRHNLLSELNKKAPTAYFTAKYPKNIPCELSFYISSNTDIEKNKKIVISNSRNLYTIPSLIGFAKKVHNFINYAQLLSIVIQLFMLLVAFFNYKSLLILFSVNIILGLLAETGLKIFAKKINHLPDQPANLDQSHQAA